MYKRQATTAAAVETTTSGKVRWRDSGMVRVEKYGRTEASLSAVVAVDVRVTVIPTTNDEQQITMITRERQNLVNRDTKRLLLHFCTKSYHGNASVLLAGRPSTDLRSDCSRIDEGKGKEGADRPKWWTYGWMQGLHVDCASCLRRRAQKCSLARVIT